jgi:hypothetical protein
MRRDLEKRIRPCWRAIIKSKYHEEMTEQQEWSYFPVIQTLRIVYEVPLMGPAIDKRADELNALQSGVLELF